MYWIEFLSSSLNLENYKEIDDYQNYKYLALNFVESEEPQIYRRPNYSSKQSLVIF